MLPRAHETDELQDHDQRAGRGFRQTETIHHLARFQPAIMKQRLLRNVGQDCVCAAERDHGRFAEKQTFFKERALPAAHRTNDQCRRQP